MADIAVAAAVAEPPLIGGGKSAADVTREICGALDSRPSGLWWCGLAISSGALVLGVVAVSYQIAIGVGTWGLNSTVGWAFDITNFVFWIGIGHAGTLISAILFLFRQRWRTSVNRAAEAMTLFAVMCAGLFPVIHMGRPWLAFWMIPYPNARGPLWVNFRSPLIWDFFAISTYLTISAIFWYIGLLPDLATVRDRTTTSGFRARIFDWLSLGWSGSNATWRRYEVVYLLLAALATPLVLSVHSIVSADFATSVVAGWHTTIFPPYFVAGAILSGMAMVLTLMLVARKTMSLESYITSRHVDAMCFLVILTGGMVGLAYGTEIFTAFYSGNPYERFAFVNRAVGPLAWGYWIMVGCNVIVPQLFWFARVRRSLVTVFVLSLLVNVGMWFERFIIIVSSLERDFLPSSWASYRPTSVEVATLVGSFGLFFTCFLLFCRFVPVIAIAEIKGVLDSPLEDSRRPMQSGESARGSGVLIGVFDRSEDLLRATEAARAEGVDVVDVFSPYAVHRLEKVLRLPSTRLTWVCFAGGLLGAAGMLLFQQWATAVSWPINVGGKPWNSVPAFIPVTFESMVLCAGVGTVVAFLWRAGLRLGRQSPLSDLRVTDDRFAVVIRPGKAAPVGAAEALLSRFHPLAVVHRDAI
jgi:molybdopterin-containing oxidoreductase family membrane subunit